MMKNKQPTTISVDKKLASPKRKTSGPIPFDKQLARASTDGKPLSIGLPTIGSPRSSIISHDFGKSKSRPPLFKIK